MWEAENTATGVYDLSATFTLEEPSSHNNYYGLVYGCRVYTSDAADE